MNNFVVVQGNGDINDDEQKEEREEWLENIAEIFCH